MPLPASTLERNQSRRSLAAMRVKPEFYRDQAQRCRDLAKVAANKSLRETLMGVAKEYDRLAAEADRHGPAND